VSKSGSVLKVSDVYLGEGFVLSVSVSCTSLCLCFHSELL
jgi:hypothetical protein